MITDYWELWVLVLVLETRGCWSEHGKHTAKGHAMKYCVLETGIGGCVQRD